MGPFLIFMLLAGIGYIVVRTLISASNSAKEKESIINQKKMELHSLERELKSNIDSCYKTVSMKKHLVESKILEFFNLGIDRNASYSSFFQEVSRIIESMEEPAKQANRKIEATVKQMWYINSDLTSLSKFEDQSTRITQLEKQNINQKVHEAIRQSTFLLNQFQDFQKKVYSISSNSKIIDKESYGKINHHYWDFLQTKKHEDVVDYITEVNKLCNSQSIEDKLSIDVDKMLDSIWFFAVEKPFSLLEFDKAKKAFHKIYGYNHIDDFLSELYVKRMLGGEEALREPIQNALKGNFNLLRGSTLPSALMWMNAYRSENMVLQYKLAKDMGLSEKEQQRLHTLTNGGNNAPVDFDVKSSDQSLYFDVSALAWRDDEYIGLFENLSFQDKVLTYSLAVRDESHDLLITPGAYIPNISDIFTKLNKAFSEEFDSTVTAQHVKCTVLTKSSEEHMEGVLAFSNECKQLGVVIHVAKIGKKLIIKFYTLFIPYGSDLMEQKQQALSIYNKLSPTITMWESSIKDTMLIAVQQLLSSNPQHTDVRLDIGSVPIDLMF